MKKFTYIFVLILLGMNLTAQSVWNGKREAIMKGSGTETDPYLIENAQNFAWLVYLVNYDYAKWTEGKYFKLTTDIDLDGNEENQWIPIGAGLSAGGGLKYFGGTIDGDYHKITGLYIDNDSEINKENSLWNASNASLFNYLSDEAQIKNLYVEGYINIENKDCTGFATLCGSLENCVSNVDIESTEYAAGFVKRANIVKNCVNLGDIKGGTSAAGITSISTDGVLENCYNVGKITADDFVGGIAGALLSADSHVKNCYNVGDIVSSESTEFAGGVVGNAYYGASVENCYYLETCIEVPNGYAEAMTAEFMRSYEFVNLLNNGTDVWQYDTQNTNNGFPILNNNVPLNIHQLYEGEESVLIYPNPSTDYIYISGDIVSCEIFDVCGRNVICNKKISGKIENISVADFTSGLYFVKCLLENGDVVTKKIIVK